MLIVLVMMYWNVYGSLGPDPERRRLEWGRAGETVTEYFLEDSVTEAESQHRGVG